MSNVRPDPVTFAFVATGGEAPSERPDTSWFADMGLQGYAAPSERGRVAGVGIRGMNPDYDYTVGFASTAAQYWTDADINNGGYYNIDGMRPGSYTMTIYKNELAVDTREVTVAAGRTNILHSISIAGDPSEVPAIWRIGDWDGSPQEFLNGDKLTKMHPSDVRIDTWDPDNFIVGVNEASDFPAYLWKEVNNDHLVYFKLNSDQIASAHTLRIGLTCAFASGRPNIKVNDWTSDFQPPSRQPKSRSQTTGSYRCNNKTHSFDIPATAWKQDPDAWNLLKISVISGSGAAGFLSAGYSVDSIDLVE